MAYTLIIHILLFARSGGIEFKPNKIPTQHKSLVIHSWSYKVCKEEVQKKAMAKFPYVLPKFVCAEQQRDKRRLKYEIIMRTQLSW